MIERFVVRRAFFGMEPRDLLPYRTPLIGALVALTVGVTGGLALRTGSQIGPDPTSYATGSGVSAVAEPVAWPGGKTPDYVIGTDFLQAQQMDQPPVVVASYEVPEYVPPAVPVPEPETPPVREIEPERAWPSTHGDILDVRLPEDQVVAPEAPLAPSAPVAVAAPTAVAAAAAATY
jgi:hypothetical protein